MFVFCSKKCPTFETNVVGSRTLWDKMFQPVGFTSDGRFQRDAHTEVSGPGA